MSEEQKNPPRAARRPEELTVHGEIRVDDYYWLREKENPEVIAYLNAENEYTATMMAQTAALQEQLYEEMLGRIQETDQTVPVRLGDYFYYSRTEEGKQYSIFCRKQGSLEAPEELLLDLNALAEGHDYLDLGIYEVSPDQRLLAYSLDRSGAEDYVIYFKDLTTGELLPDEIEDTSPAAEWANDNWTLYYVTKDATKRSDKVWRHRLGEETSDDELVYHEPDELFWVGIDKTRDRRYIMLTLWSKETTEVHFLKADDPNATFTVVQPREKGLRYQVDHHSGTFYVVTNDNAQNNRLVTAPVIAPGKENWQELVAHRPDVKLDEIDLFVDHLVLYERENGLQTLRIADLQAENAHYVDFPEPVYSYGANRNPEFKTNLLRFTYESLSTPDSVYDYNMDTKERQLLKREPVLGGYEPDDYQTKRLFATAEDGTQVPISLVYKKSLFRGGEPMPCLLYGYGSYGFSIDPSFNSNRISLLDRGFVFAIAHIRGGQEMGRYWYEQGKFLNKCNSFTDFIACARHLIAEGYTSREQLAIIGGSAGGLLVGAVLNRAPELFQAAVAAVPFVDVVTTMLDESIPLTVGEFEEWGNPKEETYYRYMLSYSPYDNVQAQAYPHLLITAGLNDPRVAFWEPAKWTARLRQMKTDNHMLLLKTEMGAGHGGPSGRYDYLKEVALQYGFILRSLEMTE